MDIVAFYGAPTEVNYINMPTDPLQHHNIINGPKMGKRAVDVDEKEINLIISLSGSFVGSPRQATMSLSLALVLVGT